MLLGAVIWVLVVIYLVQVGSGDGLWVIPVAVIGWNILLVVATILVIIDSARKIRAGKTRELATDIFVVKIAAIPFFLINFAVLFMVAVVGVAALVAGGIVLVAFVPLEITLTYIAMVATSFYGWASIARLRRDRVISTGLVVLYSILLLVFVTDIVAGILLFGHSRRRPGLALAVVLLVLGVALAVPGFLIDGLVWLGVAGVVVVVATIVVGFIRTSRLRRRVEELSPTDDEVAVAAAEAAVVDKP